MRLRQGTAELRDVRRPGPLLTVAAAGVLGNDRDADGDALAARSRGPAPR